MSNKTKIIILDVTQAISGLAEKEFGPLRIVFSDFESSEVFRNYIMSKYNEDIYISKRVPEINKDKDYYFFCAKWLSVLDTLTLETIFDTVYTVQIDFKDGYREGMGFMDWLYNNHTYKHLMED